MKDLELLGKAYYAIRSKDPGEQDARGWNKCLKAIWEEYERLINARSGT